MKILRALLAAAVLAPLAAAQIDVVINEVLYDPFGPDAGLERIELKNRGIFGANLSGWSLAVCYPGSLLDNRTYWPFPPNFKIPAGGTVTIHYLEAGIDTSTEFYTDTGAQFICVTPPKPLDDAVGSVALYDTTTCALFSSTLRIQDFVQWGGTTYHELHAQAAGLWPLGGKVPDVPEAHSIAYDGDGDAPGDWWEDASPTLSLDNPYPGIGYTNPYGSGCAGSAGIPVLDWVGGPPAMGNRSFQLRVKNALPGAPAVVALSGSPASFPALGCVIEIDATTLILQLGPKTVDAAGEAYFPLPVPDDLLLLGAPFYFQGAVVDAGAPSGLVAFSTALEAVM
jgi:hypothetical protein